MGECFDCPFLEKVVALYLDNIYLQVPSRMHDQGGSGDLQPGLITIVDHCEMAARCQPAFVVLVLPSLRVISVGKVEGIDPGQEVLWDHRFREANWVVLSDAKGVGAGVVAGVALPSLGVPHDDGLCGSEDGRWKTCLS